MVLPACSCFGSAQATTSTAAARDSTIHAGPLLDATPTGTSALNPNILVICIMLFLIAFDQKARKEDIEILPRMKDRIPESDAPMAYSLLFRGAVQRKRSKNNFSRTKEIIDP
jgi:hypothetical protein